MTKVNGVNYPLTTKGLLDRVCELKMLLRHVEDDEATRTKTIEFENDNDYNLMIMILQERFYDKHAGDVFGSWWRKNGDEIHIMLKNKELSEL